MSNLFWLTDTQMARLQPFFPKSHGKPRVDDRRVLSGIIFINRNGLRWCDSPKEYGPAKTLYNRWKRWGDKGVFARMMKGLPDRVPFRRRSRSNRHVLAMTGERVLTLEQAGLQRPQELQTVVVHALQVP
jgi:transposase